MAYELKIALPDGMNASSDGDKLTITGEKGTVEKVLFHNNVKFNVSGNEISIKTDSTKKTDTSVVGTWAAHTRNMIAGASKGYEYKLKIVYSHFPMTLKQEGDKVEIKNFLGGKKVRYAKIVGDTQVKIEKEFVTVSGSDKEAVGQTSANMERMTRVKNKDVRVFQDGVYLMERKVRA